MRELYADRCVRVTLDDQSSVLCFERSEEPYASAAEFLSIHAQVGRVLDHLGRDRHGLLVDMRRAPLNNDPDFERTAERGRAILVRGFARVAVMVRTAVGALQVKRHVREDGRDILVTTEPWRARDFLAEGPKGEAESTPPNGVAPTPPRRTGPRPAPQSTPPPPVAAKPPVDDGPFNHLAKLSGRK
jgi:hypothetical protein